MTSLNNKVNTNLFQKQICAQCLEFFTPHCVVCPYMYSLYTILYTSKFIHSLQSCVCIHLFTLCSLLSQYFYTILCNSNFTLLHVTVHLLTLYCLILVYISTVYFFNLLNTSDLFSFIFIC